MRYKNKQFYGLALGIFAVATVFSGFSTALASEITPDRVVDLVNKDRLENNVSLLKVNPQLTQAAEAKADDMVKNRYFAHTSPNGVTPWYWIEQSGYQYKYAGENLAIHFTDAETQEKAWMESVKHRENILNPKYEEIGVAMRVFPQDGQTTIVVVQMFGALPDAAAAASRTEMPQASSVAAQYKAIEKNTSDAMTFANDNKDAGIWFLALLAVVSMSIVGYARVIDDIAVLYVEMMKRKKILDREAHIQKI